MIFELRLNDENEPRTGESVPGSSGVQTSGGAGVAEGEHRWDTGAVPRLRESLVLVSTWEQRSHVGLNETQVFDS